ncbi:20511_t:CDS:2 [Gigaspora margarita]|uniref:20511_t:CDS:1 n=1 Tax=Gigaspora margarita TaxID=4874 RepID=A0ABN7VK09_GIGMA|nr:20511_t:CDS:2 [Gigaspora margarita]
MDISSGIVDYLSKLNYTKWNTIDCLKFLDKNNCSGLVFENKEEILIEFKRQLYSVSINQSLSKKARDKATKLHKNVEKIFKFKEAIAFFVQMDEKANRNIFDAKTNLYGSEVAVQMISDKLTDFQYKTSSLKRNNEEANTACLLNNDGIKRQRNQKDFTFELLTKESLDTDDDLIIGSFNVRESLMNWKLKNNPPCNDLAYYNILDLTPGTNSNFVKSYLPPEAYEQLITCEPTLQERDYSEIKVFINNMVTDFKKSVVDSYLLTRNDDEKEFLWNYANLLVHSFERDNDLLNKALSERMYREMFLTPSITNLFQKKFKDMEIYLRNNLFASAEDFDLKKDDKENRSNGHKIDIVWATKPLKIEFAIAEISGPPNEHQHSHYFNDKIKIAKMLKVMLNRIVRVYGGVKTNLNLLKLYGLQVYSENLLS